MQCNIFSFILEDDLQGITSVYPSNIHNRTMDGYSPFLFAVLNAKFRIVEYMLKSGANVNERNDEGDAGLHIAARKGLFLIAFLLLKNGAKIEQTNAFGMTPLHIAAEYGNIEVAHLMIKNQSNVEMRNNNGMTPLLLAVSSDRTTCCIYLLGAGASVSAKDNNGRTAFDIARITNNHNISKLLKHAVQAKGNMEVAVHSSLVDEFTTLANTKKCSLSFIDRLKQANAINAKNKNGLTPLHVSIMANSKDCAAKLLENGADIDATDRYGQTALHFCAVCGMKELSSFLLSKGANVDIFDVNRRTPMFYITNQRLNMHYSCMTNNMGSCMKSLAKLNNFNKKTKEGLSPIDVARIFGNKELATEIQEFEQQQKIVSHVKSFEF